MKRRTLLQSGLAAAFGTRLFAALKEDRWDDAADLLATATAGGQVNSAALHVAQRDESLTRGFGKAPSGDAMFLLGSITKPICVTALMTLFDRKEFGLD
ncbi:MAG: serine hydrolase, partial [Deltaproteobacteria bacterium]